MDEIRTVMEYMVIWIGKFYNLFLSEGLVYSVLISLPVLGFLINKVITILLPKSK